MSNTISHKTIWNDAAKSGLVLGVVTVALMVPAEYTVNMSGKLLAGIINFALWLAKFVLCIAIMKRYLIKFAEDHTGVKNSHTRRYGLAMALASALIVAAYKFISIAYINPDLYAQAIETTMENYSSMFTSSEIDTMRESLADLPALTFFTMFFYCSIYGIIVSCILSKNIPDATSIFFEEPDDEDTSVTTKGIEDENIDEQ